MKRTLLTALLVVAALAPASAFAFSGTHYTTPNGTTEVLCTNGTPHHIAIYSLPVSPTDFAIASGDCDGATWATGYGLTYGTYEAVEEDAGGPDTGLDINHGDLLASVYYLGSATLVLNHTGMQQVGFPTSLKSSFSASVSDTLGDNGLLTLIGIVLALPVVFWVITEIKKLFPDQGTARTTNFERLTLDEKPARRHYARRSYLENTDDRSDRGDYLHEGS